MKIVLSRKGFDSSKSNGVSNGNQPNPILPDGTLLSLPIPDKQGNNAFSSLHWKDLNYYDDIIHSLKPKTTIKAEDTCHLDPDLRKEVKDRLPNWKPAFGQSKSSQGLLMNAKVDIGDVFLFFGWFRQTELCDGRYRYVRRNVDFYHSADLHVVFGYMQIGEIITEPERIAAYHWHPHASVERLKTANNALYIPTDKLSFLPTQNGYGVLNYREDRVLTMENQKRGTWKELDFLYPEHVYGNKKNSAKGQGLYYCGIWQELIVFESESLTEWVKSIIDG